MGKTLGRILAVAAAVAVNVIPGLGQVLSGAIGATLATSIVNAVTLLGIRSAIGLLGVGGSGKPDTTESPLKTSRPPRVSGYGRSRLYGAYTLFETASNGSAVDVYAVHEGELDGIESHYLGDETVTVTGGVVATGADGRYKGGAVRFHTTTGSVPGAGFPELETLLPGTWTANHRGDGVVAIATVSDSVKAKDFQEVYPQSTPPVPSIVARWQKCPDPAAADPLDESAWTWTENGVRQLMHYKLVREGPRPALPRSDAGYGAALLALRESYWAAKFAPTLDYWIAAAAVCDSARALKAGGTEPRYRSAFSHKHTDEHKGPVAGLLATFDGWLAPRADGALVVYAGAYYEPTVDIGPDQIVSYSWEGTGAGDDDAVNEIACFYISADHDFNSVECDAWRDETDIAARGRVLSDPLELPVPSHAQARALAKITMARRNNADRGSVTTNIAGRVARGERFINLHLEEAGTVFFSGVAEITGLSRELTGGVSFSWVAADPNAWAWNAALEEGEPAANGPRVASVALDAPTIDGSSAAFHADGVRIALDVLADDRPDLTWLIHWRLAGASAWGPDETFSDADPGALVSLLTGVVPADASVEIQVAYKVGDGRYSPWSTVETVSTSTAAVAPGPVTDFSATDGAGSSSLSWKNPTSANFSFARVYRGTTTVFASAAQVGGDVSGGPGATVTVSNAVAAGTYYYWVRAFNASGAASAVTGPDSAVVT